MKILKAIVKISKYNTLTMWSETIYLEIKKKKNIMSFRYDDGYCSNTFESQRDIKSQEIWINYSEYINIEYFKKTLTNKNLNIKYYILDSSLNNDKTLFFDNDGHWNEYGNLAFARNLKQILIYNNIKFNKNYYNFNKKYINQFYSKHKKQF